LQNAINDLKLAKSFDRLDYAALAYKHAKRAFKTMDSLVCLRKEQGLGSDYCVLLAPFLFKLGDYLAVFVELNTDEFGNVKQLPDVCFESDEESEEEQSAADE